MDTSRDANSERAARLRRATGMLFRRIRSEAHGASGLTLSQESIVALLIDAPQGLSSAELARIEGVRAQTMSVAIASLERRGFVHREADPLDRRRTILHPTAHGIAALARSQELKQRWLEDALDACAVDDLGTLDNAMNVIERIITR